MGGLLLLELSWRPSFFGLVSPVWAWTVVVVFGGCLVLFGGVLVDFLWFGVVVIGLSLFSCVV